MQNDSEQCSCTQISATLHAMYAKKGQLCIIEKEKKKLLKSWIFIPFDISKRRKISKFNLFYSYFVVEFWTEPDLHHDDLRFFIVGAFNCKW